MMTMLVFKFYFSQNLNVKRILSLSMKVVVALGLIRSLHHIISKLLQREETFKISFKKMKFKFPLVNWIIHSVSIWNRILKQNKRLRNYLNLGQIKSQSKAIKFCFKRYISKSNKNISINSCSADSTAEAAVGWHVSLNSGMHY